jgi:hypothetical protein
MPAPPQAQALLKDGQRKARKDGAKKTVAAPRDSTAATSELSANRSRKKLVSETANFEFRGKRARPKSVFSGEGNPDFSFFRKAEKRK